MYLAYFKQTAFEFDNLIILRFLSKTPSTGVEEIKFYDRSTALILSRLD